jgi:hypothetical protein
MSPTGRRWQSATITGALAVAVVALLIAAIHGRSLTFGWFMDDYAHLRQLRACGWSLPGLASACRLELVGGVIQLWWLPDTTLTFFRPVAFGLLKVVYAASGWSPVAQHAASLLWHFAACVLLLRLLMRLGASTALAGVVTALFAIHPAHVGTVQWIACQTELTVTTFLLAATHCFGRWRGWPGFDDPASPRGPRWPWALLCTACFALALGCRENAVAFPFVMASMEPLVWRRRGRAALALYGVFALVLVAYVAIRTAALGGTAVPPPPYVIPPGDPGFLRFVFDKFWYYLGAEFLLAPVVPIAGLPYLQSHPALLYVPAVLLAALIAAVWLRGRGEAAGWIGPTWLLGFTLPVLPVFASPHHLYLPGVGWAIIAMFLIRGLQRWASTAPRGTRWRWGLVTTGIGLFGLTEAASSYYSGLVTSVGQGAEQCLVDNIVAAGNDIHDGDTLYVGNLPMLGHYARLAVEDRLGRHNLRLVPLTWAPRLLGLLGTDVSTTLTWIDDRTIEIRTAEAPFFAGPLGEIIRERTGADPPELIDRRADLGFDVRILSRNADGITALRFEFTRPLTEPDLHLFWGSRVCWACEVRPTDTGVAREHTDKAAAAASD